MRPIYNFDYKKFFSQIIVAFLGVFLSITLLELGLLSIHGAFFLSKKGYGEKEIKKILIVGDSMSILDYEVPNIVSLFFGKKKDSWPELLQKKMDENDPEQWLIINEALPGLEIDDGYLDKNFPVWLKKYKPDIVIYMVGMRDIIDANISNYRWENKANWKKILLNFRTARLLDKLLLYSKRFISLNVNLKMIFDKISVFFAKSKENNIMDADNYLLKEAEKSKEPQEYRKILLEICAEKYRIFDYSGIDRTSKDILKIFPQDSLAKDFAMLCDILGYMSFGDKVPDEIVRKLLKSNFWPGAHQFLFRNPEKTPYAKELYDCLYKGLFEEKAGDKLIENFKKLFFLAKEHKARTIFMQYPLLPIESIKVAFSDISSLEYIENKENFESAFTHFGFYGLFNDDCGVLYGHCTETGNDIISQKVMEHLL